jgi:hypothetical protein
MVRVKDIELMTFQSVMHSFPLGFNELVAVLLNFESIVILTVSETESR